MNVLVTGGAGYIGSHIVHTLVARGHRVSVIDDLSSGHRDAVDKGARFHQVDLHDGAATREIIRSEATQAIVHCAGRIQVGESVTDPRRYWRDNVIAGIKLVDAVVEAGVGVFVFSSTAAVYGAPSTPLLEETHPTAPVNPYGETKLVLERVLADCARAHGLKFAALRYFNASGANVEAGLSERHDPETHLIPLVLDAAEGRRPEIAVFGTDYPTPDGTCIRDYVHVIDLARAHVLAIEHLSSGTAPSGAYNLGTGKGYSVREVLDVAARVVGRPIPTTYGPRRAGDPAILVASPALAERTFSWRAESSDLARIVEDAWRVRRAA